MSKSFFERYQILIGIIFFVVVFAGLWQFYFKDINFSNFFSIVSPPEQQPLDPEKILYTYDVSLSVLPSPLCVGEFVTGTINSNIPNGNCTVYSDTGTGFQVLVNVRLNANGYYSTSQRIGTIGTATFRAICCDSQKNCRISNDVTLNVTSAIPPCPPPDNDGDDAVYTCGNTGLDCGGNCPSNYFCELIDSETAQWCACITGGDSGSVHPDWKPDGSHYHPVPIVEDCTTICTQKGFVSGHQVNSASECTGTEVFETNYNASLLCCCLPAGGGGGTNYCDGAIVPTGTGDAGAYCAALSGCQINNKVCDNYFNSTTQQMKCGCVATFWCQDDYVYTVTGNNCVCSPSTNYSWIDSTHYKCI